MLCKICNGKLKCVGFKEEGYIYEFYECEICGEIFIKLDNGKLV